METSKVKVSDILLRAAEIVDEDFFPWGGCAAINHAASILESSWANKQIAHDTFNLLRPRRKNVYDPYWWGRLEKKEKESRILALLFAAKIAKDEEMECRRKK